MHGVAGERILEHTIPDVDRAILVDDDRLSVAQAAQREPRRRRLAPHRDGEDVEDLALALRHRRDRHRRGDGDEAGNGWAVEDRSQRPYFLIRLRDRGDDVGVAEDPVLAETAGPFVDEIDTAGRAV